MSQSMTGFARREAESDKGDISWELRAVNHRYLELGLRLPEEFRALEAQVRECASARLRRGKVDIVLGFQRKLPAAASLSLDTELLARLAEAVHAVARALGQASPPDPVRLLRWPGLLREPADDLEGLHGLALTTLDVALDDLVEMRAREGARTAAQILERAHKVRTLAATVHERLPAVQQRSREKLAARIVELGVSPDPQRLEQELVILAQRLDVAEELERLDGHVTELERALAGEGPHGRRLDFLLQEFNREINTLGSKSQDAETTRAVVEMKVLVEQVREQVQNLE